MKENKCWKKGGVWGMWRNTKHPEKFVEIDDIGARRYIVKNEKGFNADGLISIEGSKQKAIKKAHSYMKEHNKC